MIPKVPPRDKSHPRGILGLLEAIPASTPHAHRRSARRTQICSKRNSNRINPTKNFVPLKSTISESHNGSVSAETLLATSLADAGKASLRQALSGARTGPRSLLYHSSSVIPHLQ